MGQLVAALFDELEQRYHDRELAAVATQVLVDDVLREQRRRGSPRQHGRAPTIPGTPRALRRAA